MVKATSSKRPRVTFWDRLSRDATSAQKKHPQLCGRWNSVRNTYQLFDHGHGERIKSKASHLDFDHLAQCLAMRIRNPDKRECRELLLNELIRKRLYDEEDIDPLLLPESGENPTKYLTGQRIIIRDLFGAVRRLIEQMREKVGRPARSSAIRRASNHEESVGLLDDRRQKRCSWLDRQTHINGWHSDLWIANNGGPSYNTVKRYRSGKRSTREDSVRADFAKAFECSISDVPE